MPTSVSASSQDAVEARSGLLAGQRGVAAGSTSMESQGGAASTEGEPSWAWQWEDWQSSWSALRLRLRGWKSWARSSMGGGEEDQRPGKMRRIFRGRGTDASRPLALHAAIGSSCHKAPVQTPAYSFRPPKIRLRLPALPLVSAAPCCLLLAAHPSQQTPARATPAAIAHSADHARPSPSAAFARFACTIATFSPGVLLCPTAFSCDAPVVRNVLSDATDPFCRLAHYPAAAPRAARPAWESIMSCARRRRGELALKRTAENGCRRSGMASCG